MPYLFPDTFHEGEIRKRGKNQLGNDCKTCDHEVRSRGIGYGGYLKLAIQFPDFVEYIKSVCQEFRTLYDNIREQHLIINEKSSSSELLGKDAFWETIWYTMQSTTNRIILISESLKR